MLEIEGEVGGPVLLDMNKDGKREWVFDDYDHTVQPGPEHYEVYKEMPDGTLKFWKERDNPKHKWLPIPIEWRTESDGDTPE